MKRHWNNKGRIIFGSKLLALCSTLYAKRPLLFAFCSLLFALSSLLFALCFILPDRASSGVYLDSRHGNTTAGVRRTTDFAFGFCAQCHNPHAGPSSGVSGGPYDYNLFASRVNNAICFTGGVGGACHNDRPTAYPAQEEDRVPGTATYYQHYFEEGGATRASGVANRSRWPGEAVYRDTVATVGGKDYSPHYRDTNMPLQNATGQGLCANCHNPHGVASPYGAGTTYNYDMLLNTYIDPGPTANFNLCFAVTSGGVARICHDTGGVPSLAENKLIKGLYNNPDNQAGHQIRGSTKVITGSLPIGITIGDKMPCYNCHNPHGSRGSDGLTKNAYLISDQRAGKWYGLIDTIGDAVQNRRFCFGCHVPSDGTAGSITVMGISMNKIPALTVHTLANTTNCYSCHASGTTTATAYASSSSRNVHHPGLGGDCIVCHTSAQGTRSAITPEFGLAWGHKKTGRGAVTASDCIVCHLEGNYTSQSVSALHADNNIDLRAPDGAGETAITNISGGAFTFTKFSMSFAAGSRTSTGHLSDTDIANVLTQKFCLACHDSNGATNTTARTTGGTQYMPWGGVNLGTNYTVANGAAAAGGLVNVKTQLALTNSSKHPVLGPLNRDFATAARMKDPYKPTGTRGTSGTKSNGVVINCFDCHNAPTVLTARTVAAHGNAVTLRGVCAISGTPSTTNEATLCKVCHAGYDTQTTGYHGTGSAWSLDDRSEHVPFMRWGCNMCHSSNYSTVVVRPVRALDNHGVNVLPSGGLAKINRWSTQGTPIAFIRNTVVLSNHQPKVAGGTTFTALCTGMAGAICDSSRTENYTIGGTY